MYKELRIIGPPGTGKTTALAKRAPHLLLTYADGRQIHYLHEGMHFCFEGGKGVRMPIQEPSLPQEIVQCP